MRISNRFLTFDRNSKLLLLLNKLNIPYKEEEKSYSETVKSYSLEFYLYEDDPYFQDKYIQMSEYNIEPQIRTEFSKQDEENAEWFDIGTGQFGYPQPEDDYFELTYAKENVCFHCNIGKRQINEFRLRGEPKQKHSHFLGLNWVFDEIFIRDVVKDVFEKENIKGIHYSNPVLNKSGKPLETIQQIRVETILQPGLVTDNLKSENCVRPSEEWIAYRLKTDPTYLDNPFCGQKKYYYPERGFKTFKKEIFINQPDFVKTYEWFGNGGGATRPILISKKVRDIIKQQKWRGAYFEPIALV